MVSHLALINIFQDVNDIFLIDQLLHSRDIQKIQEKIIQAVNESKRDISNNITLWAAQHNLTDIIKNYLGKVTIKKTTLIQEAIKYNNLEALNYLLDYTKEQL
ncbi:hypothetical protein NOVO_00025 [Rickettsiales bacterium Ac37b]|nr:hypothetical protein NOVO_00025 [Rickettsiales bacterium Ac37b]